MINMLAHALLFRILKLLYRFTSDTDCWIGRRPKVVAIDLDGVIFKSKSWWDEPELMPGAVESLTELKERGYFILIDTARPPHAKKLTERQLKQCGVPYDYLTVGKPLACAYIDDHAIRFTDWESLIQSLEGGD